MICRIPTLLAPHGAAQRGGVEHCSVWRSPPWSTRLRIGQAGWISAATQLLTLLLICPILIHMVEKTYSDGLADGRLAAIEHMQTSQNLRLDNHGHRIGSLERAMWIVIGAIAALEFFPILGNALQKMVE